MAFRLNFAREKFIHETMTHATHGKLPLIALWSFHRERQPPLSRHGRPKPSLLNWIHA